MARDRSLDLNPEVSPGDTRSAPFDLTETGADRYLGVHRMAPRSSTAHVPKHQAAAPPRWLIWPASRRLAVVALAASVAVVVPGAMVIEDLRRAPPLAVPLLPPLQPGEVPPAGGQGDTSPPRIPAGPGVGSDRPGGHRAAPELVPAALTSSLAPPPAAAAPRVPAATRAPQPQTWAAPDGTPTTRPGDPVNSPDDPVDSPDAPPTTPPPAPRPPDPPRARAHPSHPAHPTHPTHPLTGRPDDPPRVDPADVDPPRATPAPAEPGSQ
jgi:hypothetical protein